MMKNPRHRYSSIGMSTVKTTALIAVAVVGAALYFNSSSLIRRMDTERRVAIRNGTQIAKAMLQFRERFGSFPDQNTVLAVELESPQFKGKLNGNTSNDYFRQLIAVGLVKDEELFYVRTRYTHKGDNIVDGLEALKDGEVGFGYIMNGDRAIDIDNPERVLLVAPLLDDSGHEEFDRNALLGDAILVCCNGSVIVRPISIDNKVRLHDGGDCVLSTGRGTIWGTEIQPVIKPPKIRIRAH